MLCSSGCRAKGKLVNFHPFENTTATSWSASFSLTSCAGMYAIFDPFEPILLIRERRQLIFPLELEIFFSKNLGDSGTGGTRRPYQI